MAAPAGRLDAFEQTIGARRCVRFGVDRDGARVVPQSGLG
jgi:hypothetical protein